MTFLRIVQSETKGHARKSVNALLLDALSQFKCFCLGRTPALNNQPEKQVAEGHGGAPGKDQDSQIHQNGLDQVHN